MELNSPESIQYLFAPAVSAAAAAAYYCLLLPNYSCGWGRLWQCPFPSARTKPGWGEECQMSQPTMVIRWMSNAIAMRMYEDSLILPGNRQARIRQVKTDSTAALQTPDLSTKVEKLVKSWSFKTLIRQLRLVNQEPCPTFCNVASHAGCWKCVV